MSEILSPMSVVGGQVVVLHVDQADPLIPKVIIPAREDFEIGEVITVLFGDIVVATHRYREGDFFPVHIDLDKEALARVTGSKDVHYAIKHLDGTTSTSSSFRAKVEVFNSQSSVSHANEA
ncbi:hypothetical protein [Pseudomonas sp. C9]|jgi:hypothetical protein|uniref:hypothetical protein n=1 Tax=Pseudomonas sp. C9 TaxID=1311337 RepID=UPI000986C8EA|nr:hypothetical protein [Pseudomonas sp. C9]OOG14012.1 hypothetical protein BMS17_18485 [Pseudomonas sp. C9]